MKENEEKENPHPSRMRGRGVEVSKTLFYAAFPDEWCEYKKKYEMLNSGYYPIVNILDKMKSIDSQFASSYSEESDNIFYESNW